MKNYPLPGVTIKKVKFLREVVSPSYTGLNFKASQLEFRLSVSGIGGFYAANGNLVEYKQMHGADPEWVQLYLNTQVLVALLHQRKIINFHASSFFHNGHGIMVLGDTGAGKSSMTVSFARQGAGFLTDDLTPVVFREGKPLIWPLSRRVKLRHNTVSDLDLEHESLADAEPGTGKKYFILNPAGVESSSLDTIIRIEVGAVSTPVFYKPAPSEKFALLRSEICSWEILAGMPVTEEAYLHQLLQIIEQVQFVRVVRPVEIKIAEMHEVLRNYLERLD